MKIKKAVEKKLTNPIPVMGIEADFESLNESNSDDFSHIAERAYYKAEARGYEPGHEIQDWLEAEAEMFAKIEH